MRETIIATYKRESSLSDDCKSYHAKCTEAILMEVIFIDNSSFRKQGIMRKGKEFSDEFQIVVYFVEGKPRRYTCKTERETNEAFVVLNQIYGGDFHKI